VSLFSKINKNDAKKTTVVRLFVFFILISVVLFLALVVFLLLPRINESFDALQEQSERLSVDAYASHLYQYIDNRYLSLVDLAQHPSLLNNLLLGDQAEATIKDYLVSLRLLGEDPDVVLLDFEGNIIFEEKNQSRSFAWVAPLFSGQEFMINLISKLNYSRFELAVPVIYGGSVEGVLVAYFDATPEVVFAKSKALNSLSAVEYRKQGNVIASNYSHQNLLHRESQLLPDYGIELTHITGREHARQQRNNLITSLVYTSFFGVMLMLLLLFFIGRRIILRPYESLVETQQAIASAVEGISRIDAEGRYISLNAAYANAAGYEPKELEKAPWTTTVHPDDLSKLEDAYQTMLKQGKVVAEARGIKKDGSVFYKQVTMISQYHEDKFVGHHCFMKDISEKKQIDIEREQLIDRLVESNEWLEQFAFACSHDLQEPLRMVRVFSSKLEDVFRDNDIVDEKAYHYLQYVIDGAARSQDLISSILDYSRIDRDVERLQSVNLNELLAVLIDDLQQTPEGEAVVFDIADLPTLTANKTQLYQLFQNLLGNALKYQADGATARVEIGVEDQGKFWQIYVRDNGIGIQEKYAHKIFDVFKRLHTQTEYSGSGLGLAICKKIVERHGGLIWVESEEGKGSTFSFTILKSVGSEDSLLARGTT
jgi:PAS domain S-box-containing protein